VSLLATDGVTVPAALQPIGIVAGGSVNCALSFTAAGSCGDMIRPRLVIRDDIPDFAEFWTVLFLGTNSVEFSEIF
jgi:hypothetical protein